MSFTPPPLIADAVRESYPRFLLGVLWGEFSREVVVDSVATIVVVVVVVVTVMVLRGCVL